MSGASSLSISWVKAPKQACSYHLELSGLLLKKICETLADKSMRIPAYRYQQGIQAPNIPLGGAFSQSQFLLVSSCLQGLFVHFASVLGSELRWLKG